MKFRRRFILKQGIDLTAMVDVVFNLLIFFMLGSTMISTPQLKITLPKSNTAITTEETKSIVVGISKDGEIYLDGELIEGDGLENQLSILATDKEALDKTVQIRADEDVLTKTLINVIDSIKNAGFTKLSIATDTPTSE